MDRRPNSSRGYIVINLAIDVNLLYLELMPHKESKPEPTQGVVMTVFEDFIAALRSDSAVDPAIVSRLESALLKGRDFSVDALRNALFFEELLP